MPSKNQPKPPTPYRVTPASTIFPHFSPSPPLTGTPFPSRAPTPKPNRRLLPRRPKRSDVSACARYRLRKKGTLIDEMCSLIQQCRREAQVYNHLITSSLANMRILLVANERIIFPLAVGLGAHFTLLTNPHPHPPLTHEISSPYGPFHITGDPACRLRSASPANVPLMNC
jgi:hypothetical protein